MISDIKSSADIFPMHVIHVKQNLMPYVAWHTSRIWYTASDSESDSTRGTQIKLCKFLAQLQTGMIWPVSDQFILVIFVWLFSTVSFQMCIGHVCKMFAKLPPQLLHDLAAVAVSNQDRWQCAAKSSIMQALAGHFKGKIKLNNLLKVKQQFQPNIQFKRRPHFRKLLLTLFRVGGAQ